MDTEAERTIYEEKFFFNSSTDFLKTNMRLQFKIKVKHNKRIIICLYLYS